MSNMWLALAIPALFPVHHGLTIYFMILNLKARRLCDWYSGIGMKIWDGFDLMLLGLVAYFLGLKWRRTLGQFLARYWFVWLAIAGLIWKPGTEGRLDLSMS